MKLQGYDKYIVSLMTQNIAILFSFSSQVFSPGEEIYVEICNNDRAVRILIVYFLKMSMAKDTNPILNICSREGN